MTPPYNGRTRSARAPCVESSLRLVSNVRRRHPLVTSGSEAFCDTALFTFADLPVLLTRPHDWALPIAAAVLRGAQHPEPEVAEITFNFWYLLSEQVAGGGRFGLVWHRVVERGWLHALPHRADGLGLVEGLPRALDGLKEGDALALEQLAAAAGATQSGDGDHGRGGAARLAAGRGRERRPAGRGLHSPPEKRRAEVSRVRVRLGVFAPLLGERRDGFERAARPVLAR